MPTATEKNKALIRRFWDAMNSRQLDVLDQVLAPDVVRHCEATPHLTVRNREQVKDFLRQDTAVFPDSRQTLAHLVAEGDLVAAWSSYEGIQKGQMGPFPPSGKRARPSSDICPLPRKRMDSGGRVSIERTAQAASTWLAVRRARAPTRITRRRLPAPLRRA